MHIGSALLVIWLITGALAAGQRGYYSGSIASCTKAGTIAVTILAGPLNYTGVNPKINCTVPQPRSSRRRQIRDLVPEPDTPEGSELLPSRIHNRGGTCRVKTRPSPFGCAVPGIPGPPRGICLTLRSTLAHRSPHMNCRNRPHDRHRRRT